jgi:hypothetical protein
MEELEAIGYKRLKQIFNEFDWEQEDALLKFMNEFGVVIAAIETEKKEIEND